MDRFELESSDVGSNRSANCATPLSKSSRSFWHRLFVAKMFYNIGPQKHFCDPHKFSPERFIDDAGKFLFSNRVVPFGIGKRVCLGQTLAEKEFYLFFSGMMQQFSMEAPLGHDLPSYDYDESFPSGSLRTIPAYKIVLTNRLRS